MTPDAAAERSRTARTASTRIRPRGVVAWTAGALMIALAVAAAAYAVTTHSSPVDGLDYRAYTAAVDRLREGAPLYLDSQLRGPYVLRDVAGVAFVYPPSALFALVPAAVLGLTWWRVVGIVVLAVGLLAVLRRERRLSPIWLGVTLLVVAISEPFNQAVVLGNVSLVVAAIFAFAYAGRAAIAGAAGGALKIVPGFAAAIGGRPAIFGTVAGVAVVVGLSIALFGIDSWRAFANVIGNARPDCVDFTSIACVLEPATAFASVMAFGLGAIIALSAVFVGRPAIRLAFATAGFLVATPELQAGSHYLLVATPLLLVGASAGTRHWTTSRAKSG